MEKDIRSCVNQGDPEYCKPKIIDLYKNIDTKNYIVTIEDVAKLIPLCSGCQNYKPEKMNASS